MATEDVLFPHTCRLLQATDTENVVGQLVKSYAPRASGVACHFQPAGLRERAGRFVARVERARLWLPVGTAFAMSDRVDQISADANGATYEIAGSATWTASHIELELEAVDP